MVEVHNHLTIPSKISRRQPAFEGWIIAKAANVELASFRQPTTGHGDGGENSLQHQNSHGSASFFA
eukprot:scaffold9041_cov171-Cylindrotheca_fusiformis.AAC.5